MLKILFLIILPVTLYGQADSNIHGSLIIMAVCKDGIMVAADSRGALNKTKDYPCSDSISYYFDTIQKIHIINNWVIANAGNAVFSQQKNFLAYYISQYNKATNNNTTVLMGADGFMRFIKKNYSDVYDEFYSSNVLFFAGYENNKPTLIYISQTKGQLLVTHSGTILSEECSFYNQYNPNYTCLQAATIAEKSILNYAKQSGKTKSIGGPIMILKIAPNNTFSWIKNEPKSDRKTLSDFYKDYLNGKLKIRFPCTENKKVFEIKAKNWLNKYGK